MSVNPYRDLESDDPSFQLTVKDRMPYTYILTEGFKTFLKNTSSLEYSRREIEEAISGLVAMMPKPWTDNDEEWKNDMAEAKSMVKVDIRPSFAGFKMKPEVCKLKGIPTEKEVEVIDYFLMLNAVVNKLNRMGMVSRKDWTEVPTGMPPGAKALPKGMNLEEYMASLEVSEE